MQMKSKVSPKDKPSRGQSEGRQATMRGQSNGLGARSQQQGNSKEQASPGKGIWLVAERKFGNPGTHLPVTSWISGNWDTKGHSPRPCWKVCRHPNLHTVRRGGPRGPRMTGKEEVACIHGGILLYYLATKGHSANRDSMDEPRAMILSGISQAERGKHCVMSPVCGTSGKTRAHRSREEISGGQRWGGGAKWVKEWKGTNLQVSGKSVLACDVQHGDYS